MEERESKTSEGKGQFLSGGVSGRKIYKFALGWQFARVRNFAQMYFVSLANAWK